MPGCCPFMPKVRQVLHQVGFVDGGRDHDVVRQAMLPLGAEVEHAPQSRVP